MDSNPYLIEGDFIQTHDNLFFEVKGFLHPKNRVIAYLRYLPFETRQEKVYDLSERFQILKQSYPDYIFHSPNYDFPLQAVPHERIKKIYYPEKFLLEACNKPTTSSSLQRVIEFCQLLAQSAEIPLAHLGITGSHLINRARANSDIDLICYSHLSSIAVRNFIRNCFLKKTQGDIRPYTLTELKQLYQHRAKDSGLKMLYFLAYESRKLHQGLFKGVDFFFRFFEHHSREAYRDELPPFETTQFRKLGRISCDAWIRGDNEWWLTPSRTYLSQLEHIRIIEKINDYNQLLTHYGLSLDDLQHTFSLRGRFTENVKLLEKAHVEGTLELVKPAQSRAYLQIYLGSSLVDKFYPLI